MIEIFPVYYVARILSVSVTGGYCSKNSEE